MRDDEGHQSGPVTDLARAAALPGKLTAMAPMKVGHTVLHPLSRTPPQGKVVFL